MTSVIRGDDNFDSGAELSFAPSYNSGELPFTAGVLVAVNHGLGRVPYLWRVHARCKVSNIGYSPGDEIDITNMVDGDGSRGYVSWANASQIKYFQGAYPLQNTAGDYDGSTNTSSWRLVFYAW